MKTWDLFIMYTAYLIPVIECHGLSPHNTCTLTIFGFTVSAVQPQSMTSSRNSACVGAVSSWMKSNRLSVNCDNRSSVVRVRSTSASIAVQRTVNCRYSCWRSEVRSRSGDLYWFQSADADPCSTYDALPRNYRQITRSVSTDTFQTLMVNLLLKHT